MQYISVPAIWRNYYDVIGYQRDAASKELWLEPKMMTEINGVMTDAAYVSSEGYGTISCAEAVSEDLNDFAVSMTKKDGTHVDAAVTNNSGKSINPEFPTIF